MTSQLSAKCTLWVNRVLGAAVEIREENDLTV